MPWYDELLADAIARLGHAPNTLEDVFAWVGVFAAIATLYKMVRWCVGVAPIAYLGIVVAWRLPRATFSHRQSARQHDLATDLLTSSPHRVNAFMAMTVFHGVLFVVLGTAMMTWTIVLVQTNEAGSIAGLWAFVLALMGTWNLVTGVLDTHRKINAMMLAGRADTLDVPKERERQRELEAALAKPIPALWPFGWFLRRVERERANLRRAQVEFLDTVARLRGIPPETPPRIVIDARDAGRRPSVFD